MQSPSGANVKDFLASFTLRRIFLADVNRRFYCLAVSSDEMPIGIILFEVPIEPLGDNS